MASTSNVRFARDKLPWLEKEIGEVSQPLNMFWQCHKCSGIKFINRPSATTPPISELCSDAECRHLRCEQCFDLDEQFKALWYCNGRRIDWASTDADREKRASRFVLERDEARVSWQARQHSVLGALTGGSDAENDATDESSKSNSYVDTKRKRKEEDKDRGKRRTGRDTEVLGQEREQESSAAATKFLTQQRREGKDTPRPFAKFESPFTSSSTDSPTPSNPSDLEYGSQQAEDRRRAAADRIWDSWFTNERHSGGGEGMEDQGQGKKEDEEGEVCTDSECSECNGSEESDEESDEENVRGRSRTERGDEDGGVF